MNRIEAVVLAGAMAGAELSPESGEISRAMLPIGARTMLQWVVDALKGASAVGRVAVVGDVSADGVDLVIPHGGDLVGNIRLGVDALDSDGDVLIVSSDIPLLTPEAVDDFLKRAVQLNAGLAYPIIPRAHCEKRYPDLRRTYLKTAEGVFTGGNVMLVSRDFLDRNWQAVADAYAARKHVLRLARMIGLGVLARVIVAQAIPGVLPISLLEKRVSRVLDTHVAAVVSAYPEIGEDVDKASDLAVVRRILGTGAA